MIFQKFGKIENMASDTPFESQIIALHRNEVLNLIKEKENIEHEINAMKVILDNNNYVGISEPLVDDDGFPRQDIDVYQVRHARNRIICLQNDFKAIMKRIEEGLHVLYMHCPQDMNGTSEPSLGEPSALVLEPIARVTLVSPNSPAEEAGLMANDLILQFGSVNADNFRSLDDIGTVVKYSEGQLVVLSIRRDGTKRLHLTPQKWAGKGLLGCSIVPMDIVDR